MNGREARARLDGVDADARCEEHLRPRADLGPPPPPTALRCYSRRHRYSLLRDAAMAATTMTNVREVIRHFIIAARLFSIQQHHTQISYSMENHLIPRNTNWSNRQQLFYLHTSNFIFVGHRLRGSSCDTSIAEGLSVEEPNRAGAAGQTTLNHRSSFPPDPRATMV